MPSAYFSYFWVELEDPSRHSDTGATVLQIPVPEVERKRPGGIGIADLQPFLRPSLEAQEETQEWKGVTERMVDEVDESKRKDKVYDLRLESSRECLLRWCGTQTPRKTHLKQRTQRLNQDHFKCSTCKSSTTSSKCSQSGEDSVQLPLRGPPAQAPRQH